MYRKKVIDGYIEKMVTYDEHLKYCPNGSCGILKRGSVIILVSYTSGIIWYDTSQEAITFGAVPPNCSHTTIKHVIAFLKEYIPCLTYHDIKSAYIQDYTKVWKISEF